MVDRFFLFFKQKTAYEMRISDWSSDVCSSDLMIKRSSSEVLYSRLETTAQPSPTGPGTAPLGTAARRVGGRMKPWGAIVAALLDRSEEHTSELQSLMRISYAVFCLKKKTNYK